jgi:hypothetical protein
MSDPADAGDDHIASCAAEVAYKINKVSTRRNRTKKNASVENCWIDKKDIDS